jgi:hypothetical protein
MNPSRRNIQTPGAPEKWEVTAHKIMMRMPHLCIAMIVVMAIVQLYNYLT